MSFSIAGRIRKDEPLLPWRLKRFHSFNKRIIGMNDLFFSYDMYIQYNRESQVKRRNLPCLQTKEVPLLAEAVGFEPTSP